jgi:myosin heavy subunit
MIVQEYLLEQSRITYTAEGERNYHVFYQLAKGADRKQFELLPKEQYAYINQSGTYDCEGVDDGKGLEELRMALTVLNIDDEVQDGLLSLVSAVLATGNLQFADVDGESVRLTTEDEKLVGIMSRLLGIDKKSLAKNMVSRAIVVRGSATVIPFKLTDAHENKHAMAKALYSRAFTWLVDRINQTTNPGTATKKFIGVLDIFGFENFKVCVVSCRVVSLSLLPLPFS